jgi:hypothetical protein
MRPFIYLSLLLIISLLGFIGYCYALIDWLQDLQTGVHTRNHQEATLETSALGIYTYLATRFLLSTRMRW